MRIGRTVLALALVLAAALRATPVDAHPVPFSYLDLRLQPSAIEGTLVVHILDVAHDLNITNAERLLDPSFAAQQAGAIAKLFEGRLVARVGGVTLQPQWATVEVLPDRQSLRLRLRYPIAGPVASVAIDAQLFPYDPNHKTFVNVYESDALAQAILDRGRPRYEYFAGTRQGRLAVVQRFAASGVHHILIGPDHLLFLVGLLLLGGSIRRLALIVTAFTLAHSITLSMAVLQILTPPARIIEPAIALSIVFVGADNLLVRSGRDVRPWIAFAFGLIHGFGFANVLREMDLPSRALGWSLVSFNLGVEAGQLLVVVVAAAALAALRSWSETLGRRLGVAGSIVVIAAGAFWFVERLFFPGGVL
ncbi:MAG TPA: HupE/UreJ family protein [Vicinamibacterales bacterium]|nr:HupE/UreJ family protein [Vicinamibacterales bacterium]